MRKPNYRLTGTADSALDELFRRGATEFGITKAQDYLLGLHETFEMLARFPEVDPSMNSGGMNTPATSFSTRSRMVRLS